MNRNFFTIREQLIAVCIMSFDVGTAILKFANTKAKAYIASMKSDLRNLVTAEEAYFADSVKYSATTACTTPPTAGSVNFCVTTGNNLGTVGLAAGNGGWAVTITNNNLTTPLVKCAIFINTAALTPAEHTSALQSHSAAVWRPQLANGGHSAAAPHLSGFPPTRSTAPLRATGLAAGSELGRLHRDDPHRHLHPCPTRRSSDLDREQPRHRRPCGR